MGGTQNIFMDKGRMGTYYIEHGTAIRGTQVTYDRKESSFAKWNLSEKDWGNSGKSSFCCYRNNSRPFGKL